MPKIIYKNLSDEKILEPFINYRKEKGKFPSFRDWRKSKLKPSTKVYMERFGSWENVIKKAREIISESLKVKPRVIHTLTNNPPTNYPPDKPPKKPYVLTISIMRGFEDGGIYSR